MKYQLLENETIEMDGVTLFRIEALKDFANVKKGDRGGYVESLHNLAQEGDCWVYDEAKVTGEARVCDDAAVYNQSIVYGRARLLDCAMVRHHAVVRGSAVICDYGIASGYANVGGAAKVSEKMIVSYGKVY